MREIVIRGLGRTNPEAFKCVLKNIFWIKYNKLLIFVEIY